MSLAATQRDLEINIVSEVSQTEKDKYHIMPFICGIIFKKRRYNELIYKTEADSQH